MRVCRRRFRSLSVSHFRLSNGGTVNRGRSLPFTSGPGAVLRPRVALTRRCRGAEVQRLPVTAVAMSPADRLPPPPICRLPSDPSVLSLMKCATLAVPVKDVKGKKTFDELKEEENSLLKERVDLERDLASEHVNLNQERARSENLKKIKVDLKVESGKNSIVKQCHEQETIVKASSYQCENKNLLIESTKKLHPVLPRQAPDDEQSPTDSHRDDKKAVVSRGFVLPDLNMDPSEEEIE
ncbi:unnamed protein product [Cuscuta europaea]|uniref:Uncharacterized protein n=1 Tax=Cuscuta europaea TaxID=41803 RepID=A0A9P0Z5I4_CUSEU|nr:unnamed protein product [Cuscuta europaea]